MATLVDVASKVADLFNLETDAHWVGESLVPFIQGTKETLALMGNQSVPIC